MLRNKQISKLLRSMGLAWWGDYTRFQIMRMRHRKMNRTFKSQYPDVAFPPDYLIYESFQMDLKKYYLVGKGDAEWIIEEVSPYLHVQHLKILDWGCGPARVIRHLPSLLGMENAYFGTDYNPETILWCKAHIPGITFSLNQIDPPLPFPDDFFNLVYGISIFTHLSYTNHQRWSDELYRIIDVNGILLVTTHGEAFLERMTSAEQIQFKKGELVSRTRVKEGHRMYAAFHPPLFIKGIFEKSGFEILKHTPGKKVREDFIEQDVWVLKKLLSYIHPLLIPPVIEGPVIL